MPSCSAVSFASELGLMSADNTARTAVAAWVVAMPPLVTAAIDASS